MNKDEILAKSRYENAGQDERELQIQMKAGSIAKAFGGLLCLLLNMISVLVMENNMLICLTCDLIYCGMLAVENWIIGIRLKKKMYAIGAVVFTLLFVGFVVLFILAIL